MIKTKTIRIICPVRYSICPGISYTWRDSLHWCWWRINILFFSYILNNWAVHRVWGSEPRAVHRKISPS